MQTSLLLRFFVSAAVGDDVAFVVEAAAVTTSTREPLPKGKAQYYWPPCSNQFRTIAFSLEMLFIFFTKTSYPNEEVNSTEPSPTLSFPCF